MKKINKLFFANRWKIAFRVNHSNEIFDFKSTTPFKYVSFPKGYWGADPFLWKRDGKIYIFCEYTNEKKSKSYIAYKELYPNEENVWHVAFEFAGHTSYPCIFEHNNELFMIPETTFDNNVVVLKYDEFSKKWKRHACLLDEINAPDTTYFELNSKSYAFVYQIISRNERHLHVCELNDELLSVSNDTTVKDYSAPDGRPGGNCFMKDNKMYRVVQPGIYSYGEKINIFSFAFDGKSYNEELVVEVLPKDINIEHKERILGIHTYNKLDDVEVVDMLVKGKFDIFRPLKVLFKRMHIFGFGQYETDRLYIHKEFDKE